MLSFIVIFCCGDISITENFETYYPMIMKNTDPLLVIRRQVETVLSSGSLSDVVLVF